MALRDCAKCFLFIFNVVSFMLGVTLLVVGAYMFSQQGPFATLLPSFPFLNVTTLAMVLGSILIIVSFLGCCGAIKESRCMVSAYCVIMVCILTAELIAGGLGAANKTKVEAFIERDLTEKGLALYGADGQHGLTTGWNRMQTSLHCCGVTNATDWSRSNPKMIREDETPDSCCIMQSTGCGDDERDAKWSKGCKDALIEEIRNHIGVIAGILIGIGLFQILGIIFSFILCCSIRKG